MRPSRILPLLAIAAAQATFAQTQPAAPTPADAPAQSAAPAPAAAPSEANPPRVTAISAPKPDAPKPEPKPVLNKWTATLYGFAEADFIQDTRQGINDNPGNPTLPRPGAYGAYNSRTTFSIRNSRIGFRLSAPEWNGLKSSGMLEMDFFGNAPPAPGVSESGFYSSAGLRVRHANVKLETPWFDVLAGQYWQLFGWQPNFHPNTVEIQGVPGEVFSRSTQLRLSRMFKTDPVNVEVAVAAARPPQRDAGVPDGQGGVRVLVNDWKGVRTAGSTGTSMDALSFGVSGALRSFKVQYAPAGGTPDPVGRTATGWGLSFDALVPVIPATTADRSNALTLTGSYVRGEGINDLYSGLSNGGSSAQQLAGSSAIDAGLVAFDAQGVLHPIQYRTFIVGAQYYLPIDKGSVWLAANYSQANSDNAPDLNGPTKAWKRQRWADGCLFWDITQAVRMGAEYAWFENLYGDGQLAHNQRYQLSAFYLF